MNELIKISTSSNDITLSGRELHEFWKWIQIIQLVGLKE